MTSFRKAIFISSLFAITFYFIKQIIVVPTYAFIGIIILFSMLRAQKIENRNALKTIEMVREAATIIWQSLLYGIALTIINYPNNTADFLNNLLSNLFPAVLILVTISITIILWVKATK